MSLEIVEPLAIVVIVLILFVQLLVKIYKWLFFGSPSDIYLCEEEYYEDKCQRLMVLHRELAERMNKVEAKLATITPSTNLNT